MTDIIFLTLPRLELRSPITASAILKASVEKHGYKAFCYDLNLDLWHNIDVEKYGHVWFDTDLTFRQEEKFNKFWDEVISHQTERWCNIIREHNPKWIGMTLFSQRSRWIGEYVAKMIRQNFPEIKIVIGGAFAGHIGANFLKNKLTDAYVVGEGEEAIINVLKGHLFSPGINGNPSVQIADLDTIPIPDYSDFNLGMYPKTWPDPRVRNMNKLGTEFMYITGSRGCVRNCSFCDIGSIWPKYRYRSGQHIADEMRTQNNKFGSQKFLFTDSLINGSIKQLKELCETLIDYKNKGLMGAVKWQGQFIARPEKQMPEEIYALMKEAGCFFVSIGVESGSEKVRDHMNKMFNDIDLDFTFKMCAKYEIEMAWLLMVGYPTEDEVEFQKTLNMLEKYNWINQKGLVRSVALGPTLDIVPGSPLHNQYKELGIEWKDQEHWTYKDNTREVRIRRWLRLKETCKNLNYPVVEKATNHLLQELEEIEATKHTIMHDPLNVGPMGDSA